MKILIIANINHRINDQIRFCHHLSEHGNYKFTFLLKEKNTVKLYSIDQINTKINTKLVNEISNSNNNYVLKNIYIYKIYYIYKNLLYLKQLEKKVNDKFDQCRPDAIMLNGDRSPGIEQVCLKLSVKKRIPNFIPYLTYTGDVGPAKLRFKKKEFQNKSSIFYWLTKLLLPKQYFLYKNKFISFYLPEEILLYFFYGTLTTNPWYIGAGMANFVCLDNINNYNRFIRNGIAKSKIKLLGDVNLHNIYHSYKKRDSLKNIISKKYRLSDGKKNIIVALPQLKEHKLLSNEHHWDEIKFLINTLKKIDANILISLHPRMKLQEYQFIERNKNFTIIQERLSDFMPMADLFICTYSATLIWAVLCGINSIILDFYEFDYDVYDFLNTPIIVKNKKALQPTIKEYLNRNLNFEKDWKQLSKSEMFDGKVIWRYHFFITSMIYKRKEIQ